MKRLKSLFHSVVKPIANRLGYIHWRDNYRPDKLAFESTFARVFHQDVPVNTVIDIGAAIASWTERVKPFVPDAQYLLVEANPYHEGALTQYESQNPNVTVAMVAASDTDGKVFFDVSTEFGGVGSHEAVSDKMLEMPARSVDSLVAEHNLQAPYLLKLDTHGFEIPILEGAVNTLQNANLVIIEAYNFQIQKDSLLFFELCQYMYDRGFRVADICEPMHRPLDQLFWQVDLFFLRKDRPEFQVMSYE